MVDQLVVVLYLIFLLIIGVYQKSKSYSLKGYTTVGGGIKNNRLLLVATIFATSVGGGTIFGLSEKVFTDNLSYTYALIIAIFSDILLAIFVVPKIALHHGAISVGDIMQKYYGTTGRVIVGFSAAITSFGYTAAQISVSGRIFEHILKINLTEGVILSYLICIIYTTTGGIRSVMFTNLVQFLVMTCTVPFIAIVGISHIGFFEFLNRIPEYKYSLNANLENSLWLALGFCLMGLYPSFIQRALITDKPRNTRDAILVKSFAYMMFLCIVSLNGLLAFVAIPNVESILIIPELIHQFIPVGLKGIIVIGLLSAVMSTADTDLNIASISIVNDLMRPIFKISKQKILLLFSQITTNTVTM